MSKYRNVKTQRDGHWFDSKMEADRYSQLKLLEQAGEITRLELQPEYNCTVNGKLVCVYRGDFRYFTKTGRRVEDVKGKQTKDFIIKKKLVEACFLGVEIILIGKGGIEIAKKRRTRSKPLPDKLTAKEYRDMREAGE